jgi:hypothetical protein
MSARAHHTDAHANRICGSPVLLPHGSTIRHSGPERKLTGYACSWAGEMERDLHTNPNAKRSELASSAFSLKTAPPIHQNNHSVTSWSRWAFHSLLASSLSLFCYECIWHDSPHPPFPSTYEKGGGELAGMQTHPISLM